MAFMALSGTGKQALPKRGAEMRRCCAILVLCDALAGCAQAMQALAISSPGAKTHVATGAAHPKRTRSAAARKRRASVQGKEAARPSSPSKPPVPSEAVASPATVSLQNGKLTIEANNSDLTQILQHVAGISGMIIDGLSKRSRIFGIYGPGNPSDVLTGLLAGSGYNFIMAGHRPDGAPSELLLAAQNDNAPAPLPANQLPAASGDRENSQQPGAEMRPADPNASAPGELAPPGDTEDPQDLAKRQHQVRQRLEQQQQQNTPQ